MGKHNLIVVKLYAEHCSGEDGYDFTFDWDSRFGGHGRQNRTRADVFGECRGIIVQGKGPPTLIWAKAEKGSDIFPRLSGKSLAAWT
jgi:hypothetical protein